MFRTRLAALALLTCTLLAQTPPAPVINNVMNGASFALPQLPGGALALGSIITIFGTNMGPADIVFASSVPLQPVLGGTTVRLSASGRTFDCLMLYSSAGQVAALLPSSAPAGRSTITVLRDGIASAQFSVEIVENSFGAFTQNQAGRAAAVAFNFIAPGAEPLNTPLTPAIPNQVVTIWGTGLGPVLVDESRPTAQALPDVPVEVLVGGRRATVEYRGRSSCCVGVDQINFRVPAGITGCSVPVAIKIRDAVSNYTTIAIAPSATENCSDPLGFSTADIAVARTKGTTSFGVVNLTRTLTPQTTAPGQPAVTNQRDGGDGIFQRVDSAGLGRVARSLHIPLGTCTVFGFPGDLPAEPIGPFTPLSVTNLLLQHPTRGLRAFTATNGTYVGTFDTVSILPFGTPPAFLDPGTFTLRNDAPGPVGPFSQTFELGGSIEWTNQNALARVTRSAGVTVRWTGGQQGSIAIIRGSAPSGVTLGPQFGSGFTCLERAEAGTFTVPAEVLLSLPATVTPEGLLRAPGLLSVGQVTRVARFAPAPSGLDFGWIQYIHASERQITYE